MVLNWVFASGLHNADAALYKEQKYSFTFCLSNAARKQICLLFTLPFREKVESVYLSLFVNEKPAAAAAGNGFDENTMIQSCCKVKTMSPNRWIKSKLSEIYMPVHHYERPLSY